MGRSRPGCVTVDYVSRKIVGIGPSYASKPGSWAKVEATLLDKEMDELKRLSDWDVLRNLNPHPSWFKSLTDWEYLEIVWDDKEVVYEVRARSNLHSFIESWVGSVYDRMNVICGKITELATNYSRIADNVKHIPLDAPEFEFYEAEFLRLVRKSERVQKDGTGCSYTKPLDAQPDEE
jgi:hypothetical protein